jgi:hypothetical protein
MSSSDKQVIFKLNEHDALQLLTLIRGKLNQDDKVWHFYWKRLAHNLEESIEECAAFDFLGHFRDFEDEPG